MLRGYARVSTKKQSDNAQLDALKRAGCDTIYRDAISGTRAARPGLDQLLADIEPGDTVVVWKLDRLGRSLPHLMRVVDDLREKGVDFRSLTEELDTSTAGGRLIFHVMGALAQFERDLIRERTIEGLRSAWSNGSKSGRKFRLGPERIQLAHQLLEAGETRNTVARKLGVSRETLRRALNR